MIDTIQLRLHDLQFHEQLVNNLSRKELQQGITHRYYYYQQKDEPTHEQKLLWKRYNIFHQTGEEKDRIYFNKLKSSHYDLAYSIDYWQGCINFNFSIPKYLFGTNIQMFVPNKLSHKIPFYNNDPIKQASIDSYHHMIYFLKNFFKKNFGEIPIDYSLLNIIRIDFCYNQFFPNEVEAITHLNFQKQMRRKYLKKPEVSSKNYSSGVWFNTTEYSCKIYHKGPEFRYNDAKQMKQINKERNKKIFDIPIFQTAANRILRYEMTFRNSYMSRLYLDKVFRKDCPLWNEIYPDYKQIYNNGYLKKRDPLTGQRTGTKIQKLKLPIGNKRKYKYVQSFAKKTFHFNFGQQSEWHETTFPYTHEFKTQQYTFDRDALYTYELHKQMALKFNEFVQFFKIKCSRQMMDLLSTVLASDHNVADGLTFVAKQAGINPRRTTAIKNISKHKLRLFLNLLRSYTFEEIKDNNIFPRSTYYQYKSILNQFGINEASFNEANNWDNLDFDFYNEWILANSFSLKNLRYRF